MASINFLLSFIDFQVYIFILVVICWLFGPNQSVCSVVSHSLQPREPQHTRPPCPSPTPGVHPNPCPLSRWCNPTISFSVIPFSSCPQSFPASGSFQMSQLFASGGQSIGASASTSILPMNIRDWSPLGWTGWISLQSKGLSRVFSNTIVQINSLVLSFLHSPTLTSIHDHWKNLSPFSLFVAYHFITFNNVFRWILNSYFNAIKFVKYLFKNYILGIFFKKKNENFPYPENIKLFTYFFPNLKLYRTFKFFNTFFFHICVWFATGNDFHDF